MEMINAPNSNEKANSLERSTLAIKSSKVDTEEIHIEANPNAMTQQRIGENSSGDDMPTDYTTWHEIATLPMAEPTEFVEGLITEGFTILVGKPKQGKSTLVNSIALAIASGTKAFGELRVTQAEVAILSLETSPRRLQKDIQQMITLNTHDAFKKIHCIFNWNPDVALHAGLTHFLKEHQNVRVVIIDTLGRFLEMSGGNQAGYEKRYQVGAIIKDVADTHNVAILGLHHLRKGSVGDNPVDSIMGSSGLPAAADNIITLQRARNTGITSIEVTGRNIDEAQYRLKFLEETKSFELIMNHSEITLGRETKSLLEHMRSSGDEFTLEYLQDFCGKSKTAIANLLKTLVDRDLVCRPSHGKYKAVTSSTVEC